MDAAPQAGAAQAAIEALVHGLSDLSRSLKTRLLLIAGLAYTSISAFQRKNNICCLSSHAFSICPPHGRSFAMAFVAGALETLAVFATFGSHGFVAGASFLKPPPQSRAKRGRPHPPSGARQNTERSEARAERGEADAHRAKRASRAERDQASRPAPPPSEAEPPAKVPSSWSAHDDNDQLEEALNSMALNSLAPTSSSPHGCNFDSRG